MVKKMPSVFEPEGTALYVFLVIMLTFGMLAVIHQPFPPSGLAAAPKCNPWPECRDSGGAPIESVAACQDHNDNDGDGFCDYARGNAYCNIPGVILGDADCSSKEDTSEACVPTPETCDGQDDDCDGMIDDGGVCPTINYYCDSDNDTYFSQNISGTCSTYNCKPGACQINAGNDCDDSASTTNPLANECNLQDGIDNNCDGLIDNCLQIEPSTVIPFGCKLNDPSCTQHTYQSDAGTSCTSIPLISQWPATVSPLSAVNPFGWDKWTDPYKSEAGHTKFQQINNWYFDATPNSGSGAGLTQDKVRSLDDGHSGFRMTYFPQLVKETDIHYYNGYSPCTYIFGPRVTYGVQSFGSPAQTWIYQGASLTEWYLRSNARTFFLTGSNATPSPPSFYREFYENNFLFAAPAVGTFTDTNGTIKDRSLFLTPFFLYSQGASQTDAKLLRPIVMAAASLPPTLKTRIMRKGLFVPTMMQIFKSEIAGGMRVAESHKLAFKLPAEAFEPLEYAGPTPFLDAMLNRAHNLSHIPPVTRLEIINAAITRQPGFSYTRNYMRDEIYAYLAMIRQGETIELTIDLRKSWVDSEAEKTVQEYYVEKLSGSGSVEYLTEDKSRVKITVPWTDTPTLSNYRSDFLLLVNDGTYDSAPAYVSIRHIQPEEHSDFNILVAN